jgi:hypothetical protein
MITTYKKTKQNKTKNNNNDKENERYTVFAANIRKEKEQQPNISILWLDLNEHYWLRVR